MRIQGAPRVLVAWVAAGVLARFAVAAIAPIVTDEAYYLAWSRALDLGYFDHPPAVAWLGATSLLAPSSAFFGRLGGLAAGLLAIPFCAALFRRAGLSEPRALWSALALATLNVCGLSCGLLVVPDTLLVVAWCAALSEAAAALDGEEKRWLSAGLATGVGLLSKYMMVLALPVLFLGLALGRPRQLKTAWPWAGLLVALAVFAPHLAWNARNDWTPIRFQLHHGFAGDSPFRAGAGAELPALREPGPAEIELARRFGFDPAAPPRASEPPQSAAARTFANVAGYAGSLALWWGALIAVVAAWAFARLRGRAREPAPIRPYLRPLLAASVLVPVLFFGAVSLRSRVEANWPSVYAVGACAFLAGTAARRQRLLSICGAINVAALAALGVHARWPLHAANGDRVLDETRGYRDLAALVARSGEPVFFDRHQTGGMLRFYEPDLEAAQWPGLTRPSEFVRRREWNPWTGADLAARGSFLLVTGRLVPRGIEGFRAVEMSEVAVLAEGGRVRTRVADGAGAARTALDTSPALHRWYVVRYVPVM
jgi:4-amino-4-deoxy-L-arabinose transferase-like glycosyltransferase